MSLTSYKPVLCRVRELAHFVYVRAVLVMCILVLAVLTYLVYAAVRNVYAERERAFFQLVARVTEHVEKQHELSQLDASVKAYVPIAHVYAAMFEASERGAKSARLWQRVCKFIEDHESRIHVETQFVDGEETLVWKWVAGIKSPMAKSPLKPAENGIGLMTKSQSETATVSSSSSPNTATDLGWQGDAFDRSDRLLHSPTPCLKVTLCAIISLLTSFFIVTILFCLR